MTFDFSTNISFVTVFLQGLLSFFSPCVLPLLPVYLGYLSGTGKDESGKTYYPRGKTFVNTLAFILGISVVFFLMGFGFSEFGKLISEFKNTFILVSAGIMILFGLFHLGVFQNILPLQSEKRLPFDMNKMAANPVSAFLLGFTFSFAWTPCITPIMTSVLLMVSNANNQATGLALIFVYILGFAIPFLLTGLFTAKILNFFKSRMNILRITTKLGGVLLFIMGIITLAPLAGGRFANNLVLTSGSNSSRGERQDVIPAESALENGDLADHADSNNNKDESKTLADAASKDNSSVNASTGSQPSTENADRENENNSNADNDSSDQTDGRDLIMAFDMTLKDQNGIEHTLSDYKGKVVFLNFWATWCPPCRAEMPDIQALYEKHGKNAEDVIVLGIAGPNMGQETDVTGITKFLGDNGYDYPVLMDETWESFNDYQITAFPTTFMINKDGEIFGYVQGGIDAAMMDQMVEQTLRNEFKQ